MIDIKPNIIATDKDEGVNADVNFSCFKDKSQDHDDICEVFDISTEKVIIFNMLSQFTMYIVSLHLISYQGQRSVTWVKGSLDGARP